MPCRNVFPSNLTARVLLTYRYMQQLEDALTVSLCGQFLILLATMCFAAFSAVTVQYKNCCMMYHSKIITSEM
jgi:hypothetical protein